MLKCLQVTSLKIEIQELGSGAGKRKFEKRRSKKRMEEKSNPAPFVKGAKGCGTHVLPQD
jgi:hypothetical protein